MDMRINAPLIRQLRKARAWSQEHLAEVAGLGLRTIQRMEKEGRASYESLRSLAAVFELSVGDLLLERTPPTPWWQRRALAALAGSAFLLMAAIGLSVPGLVSAGQVQLHFEMHYDEGSADAHRSHGIMAGEDGEDMEIVIRDSLRIVLTPEITGENLVMIRSRIYEFIDGDFVLVAEPKVLTEDAKQTALSLAADSGHRLSLQLTPAIQR